MTAEALRQLLMFLRLASVHILHRNIRQAHSEFVANPPVHGRGASFSSEEILAQASNILPLPLAVFGFTASSGKVVQPFPFLHRHCGTTNLSATGNDRGAPSSFLSSFTFPLLSLLLERNSRTTAWCTSCIALITACSNFATCRAIPCCFSHFCQETL
jgi:hypothetical protein